MPVHPRLSRLVGGALIVACALSACNDQGGHPAAGSDALYAVGSDHDVCAPSERESAFTEGFDTFATRGPGPVTIDRVEWPTTGDLAVDSVRVFQREPTDQFATIGLWGGLPEDGLQGPYKRAWDRGLPAEGAQVDEADADAGYLIFVVGLTGTGGTGGPLTVHYTDSAGGTGKATSKAILTVADTCN